MKKWTLTKSFKTAQNALPEMVAYLENLNKGYEMFNELKVKLTKDDTVKIYIDNVMGKDLLMELHEDTIKDIKFSKELTKLITIALVERQVKADLKEAKNPTK